MRAVLHALVAATALAALVAGTRPASAGGRRTYEDKQRGFKVLLDEKFVQVPPKMTKTTAYIVGDWYPDAAKYAGKLQPEFQVYWFPKVTVAPITPSAGDKPAAPPAAKPPAEDEDDDGRAPPKSTEEAIDRILERNVGLFGAFQPTADRFRNDKSIKKVRTRCKAQAEYVEINGGKRKHDDPAHAYAFIGKLTLPRADETIEVGFVGLCDIDNAKKLADVFLDVVQSFEDLKTFTDSRNLAAQVDLNPEDPEAFRAAVKKTKVIPGWKCYDTPHYLVLYDKEVAPALAKSVGDQIEAIRTQVYEVLFPPDKPVKAISVVRVLKDQAQYFAYGGPRGSAGYWASSQFELVFYEDDDRKNSLRVLYHEAFHQYIFYSVGDMSPHSWFNEGHGDYFAGHNYDGGKFVRGKFSWRTDLAKATKKKPNLPPLWDWLHWTQGQYYGQNRGGLTIGEDYALGWDFVYFLRTTKKKEYQGILDRYFQTLKGYVTRAREARAEMAKLADLPPPPPPEPPAPPPPPPPGDGTPPTGDPPSGTSPGGPPADGPLPANPAPPTTNPGEPPAKDPPVADPPGTEPAGGVPAGGEPPKEGGGAPATDDPAKGGGDPPATGEPAKGGDPAKDGGSPPVTPPADPTQPGGTPAGGDPAAGGQPAPGGATPPNPPLPAGDGKGAAAKPEVPTPPVPAKTFDPQIFNERMWLDKSLEAAFKGIDMKQLEKDWKDAD